MSKVLVRAKKKINPEDSYEIRQLVDGKWVTQFVVEWRLMIMLPEEAESDG